MRGGGKNCISFLFTNGTPPINIANYPWGAIKIFHILKAVLVLRGKHIFCNKQLHVYSQ